MLEKMKWFFKGRWKQKKQNIAFSDKITQKYTDTENILIHDTIFIYQKHKPIIKRDYYFTKFHQEFIRVFHEKEITKNRIEPEQFLQFLKNLSYHSFHQIQNAVYEKHASYPTIKPYIFRLHSRDNTLVYKRDQVLIKQAYEKFLLEKLSRLQQEIKSSNEKIQHLQMFEEQIKLLYHTPKGQNHPDKVSQEHRVSVLVQEDYRQITKYVFNELKENIALEKKRRGL